jgi:hypothetical protein
MPHNPRGRNERGQDERENRLESQSRRQNASNAREPRDNEVQRGRRSDNRNYRSTILSSIDYDRNAE